MSQHRAGINSHSNHPTARGWGHRYGGPRHLFYFLLLFYLQIVGHLNRYSMSTLGTCSKVDMYDIASWSLTLSVLWAQSRTPPKFMISNPHSNKPHFIYLFLYLLKFISDIFDATPRLVLFFFLTFKTMHSVLQLM